MTGRIGGMAVAIACGALLLSACGEQSRVDPNATVRVHGTFQHVDGTPLDGRPVRLGSGVSDLEGGAGVLTAGLFCLSGACTGEFFDTTTGDDGSYAFELAGEATRSSFGEAVGFLLSTAGEPTGVHPTGPAVAARFRVQTTDLALPELRLVDPGIELAAAGREVEARWDPSVAGGPFSVLFVAEDDTVVWDATTTAGELRLDGRVLEDRSGRVAVSGTRHDRIEGSDVTILWQSASLGFHGGFGAPPSRGGACAAIAADGTHEPIPDCGLTDGSMVASGVPGVVCAQDATGASGDRCPPTSRVEVRLASPVASDLVVVRGCATTCQVWATPEGSLDPVHVGTVTARHGAVALDGGPVTAVAVEATDAIGDLAEISVWEPVADGVAPLRPVEERTGVDVSGDASGAGDDDRWWTFAAIAAAAVALVGAGTLLGRRLAG